MGLGMITKTDLIEKIPKFSSGRIVNGRFEEIHKQLSSFKYSEFELQLFEREINNWYEEKEIRRKNREEYG